MNITAEVLTDLSKDTADSDRMQTGAHTVAKADPDTLDSSVA